MLNKDRTLLLLRQHAEAVRIVETQLSHLGHSEVARALRQDLMWALVTAIATAEPHPDSVVMRRNATVLAQFEATLLARPDRPLCIAEVCGTIGVSERTLRCCCLTALGMGPARYSQLRHLERTRLELLRSCNVMARENEVAQRCGFADLRHFVAAYRKVFGALPRIGPLAG
jgi:AraC-like DNA-binding protein